MVFRMSLRPRQAFHKSSTSTTHSHSPTTQSDTHQKSEYRQKRYTYIPPPMRLGTPPVKLFAVCNYLLVGRLRGGRACVYVGKRAGGGGIVSRETMRTIPNTGAVYRPCPLLTTASTVQTVTSGSRYLLGFGGGRGVVLPNFISCTLQVRICRISTICGTYACTIFISEKLRTMKG